VEPVVDGMIFELGYVSGDVHNSHAVTLPALRPFWFFLDSRQPFRESCVWYLRVADWAPLRSKDTQMRLPRSTLVVLAVVVLALSGCGTDADAASKNDDSPASSTTSTLAVSKQSGATASPERTVPAPARCTNLTMTADVKNAILAAPRGDRSPQATVGKGSYAGACGEVSYAIVLLQSPKEVSDADAVKYQDGPDVFMTKGGGWSHVNDTGGSCPSNLVPADLLKLWGACDGGEFRFVS
jgi:hypothetical protein